MKKLVVLGVVTVLVLLSYYGMGITTEQLVKRNVIAINQTNGFNLKIVKYNRHWFTSDGLLKANIHVPKSQTKTNNQPDVVGAETYELNIPIKIHHGPIIFSNRLPKFGLGYATTTLNLPPIYDQKFNDLFNSQSTKPILNLSLFINYLKTSQINVNLPQFKLIGNLDNQQFIWHGLINTTAITASANKMSGKLSIQGFEASNKSITTILSEVSLDYLLHDTSFGLYYGKIAMSIPKFHVNDLTKKILEIDDVKLNSSSDISNNLVNYGVQLSVTKLLAAERIFGPGMLDFSIKNLDVQSLAHINKTIKAAQQSDDVQMKTALLAITPEVPKLLSHAPEFELKALSFTMPEGNIQGALKLSLEPGELTNPFALIQKIQGKGRFTLSTGVVKYLLNKLNHKQMAAQVILMDDQPQLPPLSMEQIDNKTNHQISSMLNSGLLMLQDNSYVVAFELSNGQLQINSKPFNPAMIKF